jgi:mannose-6-phosphate isomerase-like protein (cupin superfamily)
MKTKIIEPTIIQAAGNKPKRIEEYFGRVTTGDPKVSIARMVSPGGWIEPAQTPEFDEYTVVLRGELHLLIDGKHEVLRGGQAIAVSKGVRVQYSTPNADGAEYIAVCLPAFSPDLVHRES